MKPWEGKSQAGGKNHIDCEGRAIGGSVAGGNWPQSALHVGDSEAEWRFRSGGRGKLVWCRTSAEAD